MKKLFYSIGLLCFICLSSCASHFSYNPPEDAEISSGHFLLFYNEINSSESGELEPFKPTSITVDISQEGRTIISDIVDAGSWNLYPISEGVYVVNLGIEFLDNPTTLKRSFTSKVETVNALNVDFFRVEPVKLKSDVQTKKATYTGNSVKYILDSKREGKKLTFEDVQRISIAK